MRNIRDLMVRVSPVAIRPPRRKVKSTMIPRTDTSGRTLWVDIGWQACDERLITVAEVNALRVRGCRRFDRLPLSRSKR
ncbi:hypothetical protein A9W99_11050 [Mycobacterium sp. 1164966.3]|nr:hypothetical protein A9W99_11050 [Mycobacterium sp. 1164966.3]